MSQASRDVLLVELSEKLNISVVEGIAKESLTIGEAFYFDENHGEFTGFYDWLRADRERVIGVRYWPFEEIRFRYEALCRLSYVFIPEGKKFVEIYFSNDRKFDPSISADQDFGKNKVFRSPSGDYVITFNMPNLSESDLERLTGKKP